MAKKILVIGATGFVGDHCINHLLKNADWYKGVFDKMIFEDFENLIRKVTGLNFLKD